MVRDGNGGALSAPAEEHVRVADHAEASLTIHSNVDAFSEIGFASHVAGLPATPEMAMTVMGQDILLPVLISPAGVQAVRPDGEVAVARAAAARVTAMGLSCSPGWSA